MNRIVVLLAPLALLFMVPQHGAAMCIASQMVVRSGTPDAVAVVPGGHALITVGNGRASGESFSETTRELELTSAGVASRVRIDWIVPGLARLVPAAPLAAGVYEIGGATDGMTFRMGDRGTLRPPLPAPRIREIQRVETRSARSFRVDVGVQLSSPVPEGAIFTVSRWGDGGTFAPAIAGVSQTPLYVSPGRCGSTYQGHRAPGVGARTSL